MDLMYSKKYWQHYYEKYRVDNTPTPFALFCKGFMSRGNTLLDIGCGNGRDSLYFNSEGIIVTALDIADKHKNEIENEGVKFHSVDLCNKRKLFGLKVVSFWDFVYCRFLLHAIPDDIEKYVLREAYDILLPYGILCIETRSDLGVISSSLPAHYRRLINLDKLEGFLKNMNFDILYKIESDNLAVYKDDNPVVIRIICQK